MTDEIPAEVLSFAEDIRELLADGSAPLSIREEPPEEPGGDPGITLLARGIPLFYFTRDEFLEAMYAAGCDAMEDLQRTGRPLAVGASNMGPVQ